MLNRRTTIKALAALLTSIPFTKLDSCKISQEQGIQFFATNWGFEGSINKFCQQAAAAGYHGIEVWVPQEESEMVELAKATQTHNLKLALLCGNWGDSFNEQLDVFRQSIDKAIRMNPVYINCHSGKDFYTVEQNDSFLNYSFDASKKADISVYHETHRGRMLFAAPITKEYLLRHQDLHLTLDISHWCCVHESLLQDQKKTVEIALERTGHIHARVGFQEGPQVPSVSDTQFKESVEQHLEWWDSVVARQQSAGQPITITPEFGPPGYMWTHLGSGTPLASNWDLNLEIMHLLKRRYT